MEHVSAHTLLVFFPAFVYIWYCISSIVPIDTHSEKYILTNITLFTLYIYLQIMPLTRTNPILHFTCTWKQEEGLRLQLRPPTLNLIPATPLQPLINRLFGFPILARVEPIQCVAATIGDRIPAAFCEVAFGLFERYSCCNPTECNALVSEASGRMTRMEVKKGEGRTLL